MGNIKLDGVRMLCSLYILYLDFFLWSLFIPILVYL